MQTGRSGEEVLPTRRRGACGDDSELLSGQPAGAGLGEGTRQGLLQVGESRVKESLSLSPAPKGAAGQTAPGGPAPGKPGPAAHTPPKSSLRLGQSVPGFHSFIFNLEEKCEVLY